jgi:hypothetical protein
MPYATDPTKRYHIIAIATGSCACDEKNVVLFSIFDAQIARNCDDCSNELSALDKDIAFYT